MIVTDFPFRILLKYKNDSYPKCCLSSGVSMPNNLILNFLPSPSKTSIVSPSTILTTSASKSAKVYVLDKKRIIIKNILIIMKVKLNEKTKLYPSISSSSIS